ncbi:MAG: ABC transporter permease subunit [Bacteroidales bacterium]|nr:ABC transporter permease subunit [Candidatus Colimorpha onthohippi]
MKITTKTLMCKSLAWIIIAVAMLCTVACQNQSAQKTSGTDVTCLADLNSCNVSSLTGSIPDIHITKNYPDIKIHRFNTVAEEFEALNKGIIDYVICDASDVTAVDLKARGLKVCFVDPTMGPFDNGVAFKLDNAKLCNQFNSFLKSYRESGQLEKSYEYWATGDVQNKKMPKINIPKDSESTLRVGVINLMPFSYIKDGEWHGFEIEMIERFAEATNQSIDIQCYDFVALLPAIQTGKIDLAVATMYKTEERKKQVLFSDTYHQSRIICVGRDNAPVQTDTISKSKGTVKSLDEVSQKRLIVLTGSLPDVVLSSRYPNSKYVRVATASEVLTALECDKGDVAALDSCLIIGGNIEKRGISCSFVSYDTAIAGYAAMAFNLNNQELCDQYNTFFDSIKENGILDEMTHRWTTGDVHNAPMPDFNIPTEGDVIRVACDNSVPFTFVRNGEWVGFEAELMCRFAEYSGRPIKFYAYEFCNMISALQVNKIDVIASFIFITPERKKQVLFSHPHYYAGIGFFEHPHSNTDRHKLKTGTLKERFHQNIIEEQRWKMLIDGFWETIIISVFSILFGSILGGFICRMRMHKNRLLKGIAKWYIEILRDIPILVFLMVMFYLVFASSRLTATWVAIIAFSMNFAAYVSEMFRVAIEGVNYGQTEAGLAMGFSKMKTFVNFVAPQAIRKAIPVYKGEVVALIKNTSIVGYIAVLDLTKVSDIIRSRTFDAFFPLIIISIIYFLLAWGVGLLLSSCIKEKKSASSQSE